VNKEELINITKNKFDNLSKAFDEFVEDTKNIEKNKVEEEKKATENKIYYSIEYEKFIADLYYQKGYEVIHIGIIGDIESRKEISNTEDDGIDIIAIKENKTKLIQCKYWTNKTLTRSVIKEFKTSCNDYLKNNKITEKENYDFILVLPTFKNIYGPTINYLNKDKEIKLEKIKMLENGRRLILKLILGIIEAKTICYKCKKEIEVIALLFYNNYDFIKIEDKKAKATIKYKIQNLDKDILELIQEKYPNYKYKKTTKDRISYIVNHCNYCGIFQNDEFLHEKDNGVFSNLYKLEPKYFIGLDEIMKDLKYIN